MSVKNFIPELWASRILEPFYKSLVFADVVNRDYEGEIKQVTGFGSQALGRSQSVTTRAL
jgi:hypothetical protein